MGRVGGKFTPVERHRFTSRKCAEGEEGKRGEWRKHLYRLPGHRDTRRRCWLSESWQRKSQQSYSKGWACGHSPEHLPSGITVGIKLVHHFQTRPLLRMYWFGWTLRPGLFQSEIPNPQGFSVDFFWGRPSYLDFKSAEIFLLKRLLSLPPKALGERGTEKACSGIKGNIPNGLILPSPSYERTCAYSMCVTYPPRKV